MIRPSSRAGGRHAACWTARAIACAIACLAASTAGAEDLPDNPTYGVDRVEADWWKTGSNSPCNRGLLYYNFGPNWNSPNNTHVWIKYMAVWFHGEFIAWGVEWGGAGWANPPIDFDWRNLGAGGGYASGDAATTPGLDCYAPNGGAASWLRMLAARADPVCDPSVLASLIPGDPLVAIPANTSLDSSCAGR